MWVVLELNEIIHVRTIVIGSFEYYSSTPHKFQVLGQLVYPTDHWNVLGYFEASSGHNRQEFTLKAPMMAKVLKIRLLTHHGSEFYCTMSKVQVFGTTQWEEMGRALEENEQQVEIVKRALDGKEEKQNKEKESAAADAAASAAAAAAEAASGAGAAGAGGGMGGAAVAGGSGGITTGNETHNASAVPAEAAAVAGGDGVGETEGAGGVLHAASANVSGDCSGAGVVEDGGTASTGSGARGASAQGGAAAGAGDGAGAVGAGGEGGMKAVGGLASHVAGGVAQKATLVKTPAAVELSVEDAADVEGQGDRNGGASTVRAVEGAGAASTVGAAVGGEGRAAGGAGGEAETRAAILGQVLTFVRLPHLFLCLCMCVWRVWFPCSHAGP
jgi:hypothetical protein